MTQKLPDFFDFNRLLIRSIIPATSYMTDLPWLMIFFSLSTVSVSDAAVASISWLVRRRPFIMPILCARCIWISTLIWLCSQKLDNFIGKDRWVMDRRITAGRAASGKTGIKIRFNCNAQYYMVDE